MICKVKINRKTLLITSYQLLKFSLFEQSNSYPQCRVKTVVVLVSEMTFEK